MLNTVTMETADGPECQVFLDDGEQHPLDGAVYQLALGYCQCPPDHKVYGAHCLNMAGYDPEILSGDLFCTIQSDNSRFMS